MNNANSIPVTLAELQGLSATAGGRVKRIYRKNGNVLKAKGISSAVLWRLDRKKLIKDGAERANGFETVCTQVLTAEGDAMLDAMVGYTKVNIAAQPIGARNDS